MSKQYVVVLSYDTHADSPQEAVRTMLAAASVGAVYFEVFQEGKEKGSVVEGFLAELPSP